jgi:chaperonin GroES
MAKKSAKKSATAAKKPAAKSGSRAKASSAKSASKSGGKGSKAKPAAKSAAAKKSSSKASAKTAKASKAKGAKPAAKTKSGGATAAKAVAAVGAIAGVAYGVVKVASKAKTDVSSFFSPLDDRLIVEEVKKELRTAGGLFIPDTAAAPSGPKEGIVLAVGRGHRDKKGRMRPLDVKMGDTVLFEAFLGSELKIGDREVTVIRESQLLGIKAD